MQIDRLRLVNFRQHEDSELILGAGLTGIIGPNGAGKTTLLEAIAWALYGAEAARGTRETIRRRGASPRAPVRVELEFSLGPHHYRAVRTLNGAELYQDGDPAPIANSIAEVSGRVGRLLGMSRDEFFNTYFTGQKQLATMSAMRPVERAQFLSRVLGFDRLQLAQDRLRERRVNSRARLQALQSSLPDPVDLDREEERARMRLEAARTEVGRVSQSLTTIEHRRAEVVPRWESTQKQREHTRTLDGELRIADHRVQSARQAFQGLDRELVAANEANAKLEALRPLLAPLEALRAERSDLDAAAERFAACQAALAQLEEVRKNLVGIEARIGRLPTAEAVTAAGTRVTELQRQSVELGERAEERRTTWVRDLQDAKTKRESLIEQYRDLKQQLSLITAAGPEGVCPTCSRPLKEEYNKVEGMLDRQLQEVLFNGNFYKQRIEQLQVEPSELRDLDREQTELDKMLSEASAQAGRLQARAQEQTGLLQEQAKLWQRIHELEHTVRDAPAGYDSAHHAEVRRLIAELEPLTLQAERYRAAAERAATLVRDAETAERELTTREIHARELRQQIEELGYTEEAFSAAREAHDAVEREQREAEMAMVRFRAEWGAAEESVTTVARRRAERAAREEEARQVSRQVALYNELDRAFTDLRTDLNTQLRPDLSELASGFLRDLTNDRYTEMELDEDYMATLLDGGEAKPVISGGEEDVASLALRLAISQMIADRAGQPLSLLVLDEIFGSLDEERRTAVVELLRTLADRFPQVILITHIESVRDGFDRVIRVEFDEQKGAARVYDEAPEEIGGLAA